MGDGAAATLARPAASPAQRPAGRVARPSWRDGRLVLGVVLVLLSVLIGARVLASARATTPVLVAARSLPAGHLVAPGDLEVRAIRLSGLPGRYWSDGDLVGLTGHRLATSVAAGDLLPRSAVAEGGAASPSRVVSLPVEVARLPNLRPGDRVDVFATYPGAGGTRGPTVAVVRGVDVLGRDDTGRAAAIRLDVPVAQVGTLVRASQIAALDVVLVRAAGDPDEIGDVGGSVVADPAGVAIEAKR